MRKAAAILTAVALAIGVLAGCSHFAASEDAGEAADHATERNGYQAGSEHSGSEGDAPSAADAVGDDTARDSASIEADAGNAEGGDDMQTNRIEVKADDATVGFGSQVNMPMGGCGSGARAPEHFVGQVCESLLLQEPKSCIIFTCFRPRSNGKTNAGVAELADAYGSGPYGGNPMKVQVLSPAPF